MRVLLAVIFFCNLALAQQSVRTVYLVRHAENTSAKDDPTLSPAGAKRADCLATTLKDAGIKQIYVTEEKRTKQTADPLAKQLKITPTVLPVGDPGNLVRDVFYSGKGNTLVVGDSSNLPIILARMKAGTIKPFADNDFDRIFMVTTMEGSAMPVVTLHYCQGLTSTGSSSQSQSTHTATPAQKTPVRK
jgi:phosphohistidine phosphatase SixA